MAVWKERPKFIALTAAVLIFATVVPMSPGQEELPFPWFKCPYRQLTGKPCPLCGSTRAFIHAAHGHFRDAISLNPIGLIAYFGAWAFLAYHSFKYWQEKKEDCEGSAGLGSS